MKFQYKYILFMLIAICILSSSYAVEELKYRRGDPIDLKVPCINNDKPCTNAALCNITLIYPNGSTYAKDRSITSNNGLLNFTMNDTTRAGTYQASIFCEDNAQFGYSTFYFHILTAGWISVTPLTVVIALAVICLVLLAIAQMVGDEHQILKLFFIVTAVFFAVVGIPAALMSDIISQNIFKYSAYISYFFVGYIVVWMFVMILLKVKESGENNKPEE